MASTTATITTSAGADGIVSANANFTTARDSATGTTGNTTFLDRLDTPTYSIGRYFMFFDLSAVPTDATITGITFVFPSVGSVQNADTDSVILTAHTAADPPVAASFNDITLDAPTSFGSETFANLNTGGTTDIAMTGDAVTAAQAAIGTVWKVCIRGNRDVTDAAPTGLNQFSFTLTDSDIQVTYDTEGAGSYSYFM